MKKQNRWSKEDFELLKSLMHKGLSYEDLLSYFPERTKSNIKAKIEKEKLCGGFMRSDMWTDNEIKLLKELYPITKSDELSGHFPNKTKSAIYTKARRLGLFKNYEWTPENFENACRNRWNDEKSKELKAVFYKLGEEETYKYFKEKYNHGKYNISNKMIALGLIESNMKKYGILDRKNPNFYNVFVVYKDILRGNTESFKKHLSNITKQQLVLLYRYYNRINNIEVTREYFINGKIGNMMKEAKIKMLVVKRFHSYFDFICFCYPNLNLKPWELKNVDVKDSFWENKFNRFWCIRNGLDRLLKDGVIKHHHEALELNHNTLYEYMSSSLLYYHTKSSIEEYFDFIKYDYLNSKTYNNIRFDSFQEKYVYKIIYENITKDICKCSKKEGFYYKNKECNENYIPDFYIQLKNKIIIIEYFGMYKDNNNLNKILRDYRDKTYRKIEYFNSLDNVYFIPLFPKDLNNNFKGVRDKLTSFYMSKNIDLKGGGTDE